MMDIIKSFVSWIKNSTFGIRMFFQRVFRKSHVSDYDLWGLDAVMAKKLIPMIVEFRDSNRHGYPFSFSTYEDGGWKSEEDYRKDVESGAIVGGGFEAWTETINKIIKSLDYCVHDGRADEESWFVRYYGKSPYEETDDNKSVSYHYTDENGQSVMVSSLEEIPGGAEFRTSVHFINNDLLILGLKDVDEGLALFGKYFRSFWD